MIWCSISSHLLLVLTICFFLRIVWEPRTIQLRPCVVCLMLQWRTKVRSIWTSQDALWRRSSWAKWRHFNQTNGNRSECPRRRHGLWCLVWGGFEGRGETVWCVPFCYSHMLACWWNALKCSRDINYLRGSACIHWDQFNHEEGGNMLLRNHITLQWYLG